MRCIDEGSTGVSESGIRRGEKRGEGGGGGGG